MKLLVAWLSIACATALAQHAYHLSGDYRGTHDPSIAKDRNTWYVFATGKAKQGGQLQIRCSQDLRHWTFCGQVFDQIPGWIHQESPGTVDLWAPDISYYKGEYRLYYAYSLFGKNTSGIALATSRTLDRRRANYKWVDKGLVLRSSASDDYNAIDPNFVVDQQGRSWLAFGSFWSGIKLRRLDETGMPSKEDTRMYSIAARAKPNDATPTTPGVPSNWQAVEAPFIVRHGKYYYLFLSWDLCCRGVKSTYHIRVGRAEKITGPYLDKIGKSMAEGGGSELLAANSAWLGPGGESAWIGKRNDILVFHAYDAVTGKPALQVSTINWGDGWPAVALSTNNEPAP